MAAKKKKSNKASSLQNVDQDESSSIDRAGPHTKAAVKGEDLMYISPSRIRYQHSRIRPYFSGCGRSVMDTMEAIRRGKLEPNALPPIQVLVGPDENDGLGPWYFSLNNRRLWVLKQCHKEGILDNERYNNTIAVRVRLPKSNAESERYTVDNCALEAKFIREGKKKGKTKKNGPVVQSETNDNFDDTEVSLSNEFRNMNTELDVDNVDEQNCDETSCKSKEYNSDSESESSDDIAHDNPFSLLS